MEQYYFYKDFFNLDNYQFSKLYPHHFLEN